MFFRILSVVSLLALTIAIGLVAGEGGPSIPGDSAPATPGHPAPADGGGNNLFFFLMMLAVVAFMYFVLIRPQQKEEKRRKEMIAAVKRGDRVVTIGGAHGVVDSVGEKTVDLRLGTDKSAVVTFNLGSISTNLTAEEATKGAKP